MLSLEPPINTSDRGVIDALYMRFGRAIVSKAHHVVGRWDVAHEITQDVFIRAWQTGISFDHEEKVFGWLFRTCHNASIDYLRSAVHRREHLNDGQEMDVVDENTMDEMVQSRDYCRKLLAKFSKRDAQIIGYVVFDEMTYEETADNLGIAKKTVTRAMQKIKFRMKTLGLCDGSE